MKGRAIKGLIADHLTGANDRTQCERWVPRWMAFPPAVYTARGGVPMVAAARRAKWMVGDAPPAEQEGNAALTCQQVTTGDGTAKEAISAREDDREGAALPC